MRRRALEEGDSEEEDDGDEVDWSDEDQGSHNAM